MKPGPPRIGGKDLSVYNPAKVRQGLKLWVEALIRNIPRQGPDGAGSEGSGRPV